MADIKDFTSSISGGVYGYYYIPTVITSSISRNKLTEPLCRYDERLAISYILLRSRNMRDKIVTVALALGIAGAATIGVIGILKAFGVKIGSHDDTNNSSTNTTKSNHSPYILDEAVTGVELQGTKVDLTNSERLFVYSATFMVDSIEEVFTKSPEFYISKTKMLVPSASFLKVSISQDPFLICFREEYDHLKQNSKVEPYYNTIIVDSLQDLVTANIRLKDGDKMTTEISLTSLKRSVGDIDLSIKKLPMLMKDVRVI